MRETYMCAAKVMVFTCKKKIVHCAGELHAHQVYNCCVVCTAAWIYGVLRYTCWTHHSNPFEVFWIDPKYMSSSVYVKPEIHFCHDSILVPCLMKHADEKEINKAFYRTTNLRVMPTYGDLCNSVEMVLCWFLDVSCDNGSITVGEQWYCCNKLPGNVSVIPASVCVCLYFSLCCFFFLNHKCNNSTS